MPENCSKSCIEASRVSSPRDTALRGRARAREDFYCLSSLFSIFRGVPSVCTYGRIGIGMCFFLLFSHLLSIFLPLPLFVPCYLPLFLTVPLFHSLPFSLSTSLHFLSLSLSSLFPLSFYFALSLSHILCISFSPPLSPSPSPTYPYIHKGALTPPDHPLSC